MALWVPLGLTGCGDASSVAAVDVAALEQGAEGQDASAQNANGTATGHDDGSGHHAGMQGVSQEGEEDEIYLREDGVLEVIPSVERTVRWEELEDGERAEWIEDLGYEPRAFDVDDVRQQAESRARQRFLEEAATLAPGEEVDVIVMVEFDGPPLPRLRDLEVPEREAAVESRRTLVTEDSQALRGWIGERQGTVVDVYWLVPGLSARIRAEHLEDLANNPGVRSVSFSRAAVPTGYSGGHYRNALRVTGLVNASFTGGGYMTGGVPIRVAVIEAEEGNWLRTSGGSFHNAFRRPFFFSLLPTVERHLTCNNGPCVAITSQPTNEHGQSVTSILAGSLQEGQDPDCALPSNCSAPEQLRRSGVAPHVELYYYNALQTGDAIAAIQDLVFHEVEVVNMSFVTNYFEPQYDCSLWEMSLANPLHVVIAIAFVQEGVLFVASSGNNTTLALAAQNHCNIMAPAVSQYTVAVGGLASEDQNTPWDSLIPSVYHYGFAGSMRFGGVPELVIAGSSIKRSYVALDLLAPANRRFTQTIDAISGSDAYTASLVTGSSYATPAVSGAAALVIEGIRQRGWSESPQRVMGLLFLGADRARFSFSLQNGVQELVRGIMGPYVSSGFGRARVFAAQSSGWPGPWSAWAPRERTVTQGSTWIRQVNSGQPVPSTTPEYRVVVYWFDADLTSASHATVRVFNTCPSGGGSPVQVGSNLTHNPRKRVVINNAVGMCLEVRVQGHVTPSGGLDFWVRDLRFGSGP